MSDPEAMRETAREVLRELLPEVIGALQAAPANDNGHTPVVPAPPVAAVLRPSTWAGPATPGEIVGEGSAVEGAETVTLSDDADLQRFVAALAARCEDPGQRQALRTGQVRFTLGRSAAPSAAASGSVIRIDKGAVTERMVRKAAADGARLVLARRAVLTPLARDQARALRVVIEREDR